jgi:hypothetical protein
MDASDQQLVVGLDIAGRTGVTEGIIGSVPEIYTEQFTLPDDPSVAEAFGRAIKFMATRLNRIKPVTIFVEGVVPENKLAGFSNHSSSMIRVGLYGAIVGVARAKDIPVIPVNIARVTTHFLGRGHKLAGDERKRAIYRRCEQLGWAPPNLDGSDSAAVWSFGCEQIRAQNLFGGLHHDGL